MGVRNSTRNHSKKLYFFAPPTDGRPEQRRMRPFIEPTHRGPDWIRPTPRRRRPVIGPAFFWKRSQQRPWCPVIGPDRKPFVSDPKIYGVSRARSRILRTCKILEAISAAPMVPRYRSRSEAFCTRSGNSWSLNGAIQNCCGPENFWKRSQPRP